jgi:hypothetical protein
VVSTDATNTSGDISSPFTAWPGPGTAFLYLDIVNSTGSQDVTFATTPSITITSTVGFPTTNCYLIAYASNGSGSPSWMVVGGPVSPSNGTGNGTLSFPGYTLGGGTIDLAPGVHNYPGFECQ